MFVCSLTEHVSQKGGSGAGREVHTYVIHRSPGESDDDSHQRVYSVTVQRYDHQKHTAQAVHYREEQTQLHGNKHTESIKRIINQGNNKIKMSTLLQVLNI